MRRRKSAKRTPPRPSERVQQAIAGALAGIDLDAKTRARLAHDLGEALAGVCDGGFTLDLEPIELDLEPIDLSFDEALLDWHFDDLDKALADMTAQDDALLAQLAQEPDVCPFCGQPMPSKGAT